MEEMTMKKLYQLPCLIFALVFMTLLAAWSSDNPDSSEQGTVTEFQEEFLSFEELVQRSDVAVIGEYLDTTEYENHVEHRFKVKECLYGDVPDEEIYLYSNIGTGYISETGYSYELGADIYTEGVEYILIVEQLQSIMYDHDRYLLTTDIFLCNDSGEYLMYSQPIDIPAGTSAEDYICSVHNSAADLNSDSDFQSADADTPVSYETGVAEMVGESQYVGIIKIESLENENTTHNGNAYRCLAESLMKGTNLNTFDDGTFIIVILKDTVDVGSSYIIGFSPVDEQDSLVYIQATETSVYPVSDELTAEISQALTE